MHTRTGVTSYHVTFCLQLGNQISYQSFLGIGWFYTGDINFKLTWVFWCFSLLFTDWFCLGHNVTLKSSQHNKCVSFHKLLYDQLFFLHPTIHSDLWQPTQQISVALVVSKKCCQVSSNVPPLSTTCRLLSATVNKKLFAVLHHTTILWHQLGSNSHWLTKISFR